MHFDRFPGHVRIYLLQYYTTQHALISRRKKEHLALAPKLEVLPKKKKVYTLQYKFKCAYIYTHFLNVISWLIAMVSLSDIPDW